MMSNNRNNDGYDDFFDIMPEDNDKDYDLDYFAPSNYSKSSKTNRAGKNSKKSKNDGKSKKGTKNSPSKLKKSLLSVALIFVITVCLIVSIFTVFVVCFVDGTIEEDLDSLKLALSTTVYIKDDDGDWIEYQRLFGDINRVWADYNKIPDNLKNAFVAIEDQRFESHNGVDIKRTVLGFANEFLHFYSSRQGGSTITQQLVKNLTGDNQQTPMRKIREIKRAMYVEKNYSKDTILECYMNTIGVGGNRCGVEVAANYYFGKSVSKLTLTESAAIAALAKNPELYRPDIYPEENKERRQLVLKAMYDQGYITKEKYEKAKDKKLKILADNSKAKVSKVNNYFIDALIDDVINDMVEQLDMEKSYAVNNFYNGGYKIYATLDPDIQRDMEKVYKNVETYFPQRSSKKSGVRPESAMTIMDYKGHIVGIVGGKGQKKQNRVLNRATSSPRQPGSTMKPIGAYAPALEENLITYSSVINSSKIKGYFGAGKAGPNNWDGKYYDGVTAQFGVEHSVNTAPCQLIKEKVTIDGSFKFLTKNLGISTLTSSDKNLSSLGLGGCEYGITTTQSAAAYATFGNQGMYYEPTTYYKVCDSSGKKVILKQSKGKRAMGDDTASIMNRMLQTVVYGANGTGGRARSYSSMPLYAKTGTSNESNDLWFVGGTPYYIGSVWYGFDQIEDVYNGDSACRIWRDVMRDVHNGLKYKDFEYSENVVKRSFCTETGKLAGDKCKSATGYYKTDEIPDKCNGKHKAKKDDKDKKPTSSTTSATSSNTSSVVDNTSSLPPSTEETSSIPDTSNPTDAQ